MKNLRSFETENTKRPRNTLSPHGSFPCTGRYALPVLLLFCCLFKTRTEWPTLSNSYGLSQVHKAECLIPRLRMKHAPCSPISANSPRKSRYTGKFAVNRWEDCDWATTNPLPVALEINAPLLLPSPSHGFAACRRHLAPRKGNRLRRLCPVRLPKGIPP